MGGALLAGWLQRGIAAADVVVVEPNSVPDLPAGLRQVAEAATIPADFAPDIVMLAVKPQARDQAAPAYAGYAGRGASIGRASCRERLLQSVEIPGVAVSLTKQTINTRKP